jgi:protein-tyrosine phosphatase
VLFRSGNLARLTTDGRTVLDALGFAASSTCATTSELALDPSRIEGLGIEVQHVPLFLGSAASFFDDDISLESMYRGLIDTAPERIVAVVRGVLGAQPTLVHCTVGKDRTGVTIALVLSAVGVDREAVVADYARTEQLLPAERNARSSATCVPCTPRRVTSKTSRHDRPPARCGRSSPTSTRDSGHRRRTCRPTASRMRSSQACVTCCWSA